MQPPSHSETGEIIFLIYCKRGGNARYNGGGEREEEETTPIETIDPLKILGGEKINTKKLPLIAILTFVGAWSSAKIGWPVWPLMAIPGGVGLLG